MRATVHGFARRLARGCAVVGLAVPGVALAYDFQVDGWSVEWLGFEDDFEDGVLADGEPGEPSHYQPVCGATGDAGESAAIVESDGLLELSGPDAACDGAILGAQLGVPTPSETRVTFRFQVPALGESYGITLSTPDQSDFVNLSLARAAVPPLLQPDVLLVVLAADPFADGSPAFVQIAILSTTPPHADVSGQAIELKLGVVPGPGGTLIPDGSYRLCTGSPCESETTTPFLPLTATGLSSDGGALDAGVLHYPAFTALGVPGGDPFSFAIEEWSTRGRADDDFSDGIFSDAPPYLPPASFGCDGVSEAGGFLRLRGPGAACGATYAVLSGVMPGPLTATARFAFTVPRPCESFGVSLGNDGSRFPFDQAWLQVARAADPSGALDVLQVVLGSESEAGSGGPSNPIARQAILSFDPDADPALEGVTAIELSLALEPDAEGLAPVPGYRLCTASSCSEAFTPLAPYVPPAGLPDTICGLPVASYAPPADGVGRMTTPEAIGASLFAAPEPGAAAAGLAGLAGLSLLARRWNRRS